MTFPSKKNYGKTNRKKGHDAERYYAKVFRNIGYPMCVTSRQGSRLHDDCGVDLIFLPFNVQIKAGIQRGLNPVKVLKDMEQRMIKSFPSEHPIHTYPSVIVTRKPAGRGKRRTKFEDLVILTFSDFEKIIKSNATKIESDDSTGQSEFD